ncbi:mevalonate kinase [Lactobacillus sp. S2-2]|uniref:mevalonate kinase n=1 Tax=Lactobacillus sp. S2-2 TaxID=2692917 RepID=UPI001F00CE91|nr:mevalonate kinase [Lactobacillus sp. S2-2]MCF6515073.1 mevalonate kinase [Lactobacillus sp. S2-2]
MMTNFAIGESHAKIILFGEHSAVYGKGAITLPIFKLKVSVKLTTNLKNNEIESDIYNGSLINAPLEFNGIKSLIFHMFKINNLENYFINIKFENNIPIGRGLGSSAAVSCAIIKAFYKFFNLDLTHSKLISLINISEQIIHGNPSGIDAQTVTSESPIFFENNEIKKVPFNFDGDIIITDTEKVGSTKEAVSIVRKLIDKNPEEYELINQLGNIVKNAKKSIDNKNIENIGNLMNKSQNILSYFGISTNEINDIIKISNYNGALGSKITGSGLGGCVISLSKDSFTTKKIIKSLQNNGYKKNWIQPLKDFEME